MDSIIIVKINGKITKPNFTPSLHRPLPPLTFIRTRAGYQATIQRFQKDMSLGFLADATICDISSLPVPKDLTKPLTIRILIPDGKDLLWHGQVWEEGYAELTFASYFIAREFPAHLVKEGSYVIRVSRFNRVDSLATFFIYENNETKAALPLAFQAVDTAALNVGYYSPKFLGDKVIPYNGSNYTLVVYLTKSRVLTASEHFNNPYIIFPYQRISEEGVFHNLFHSYFGKSLFPKQYLHRDGHYCPSDALAMYEGFTTYMSLKYTKGNYAAVLSAMLYRAKLKANLNDLRLIGLDTEYESYYAKGYLFWLYMESRGLNVELFGKWLLTIHLINKPFPVKFDWAEVIKWITIYDKRLGQLAAECSKGSYIDGAFRVLKEKGWKPNPLKNMPRWYDFHLGPYPIKPGDYQLPTDNYPILKSCPVYFLLADGKKLKIEADKNNPALRMIKDNPDSSFKVEFSDGQVITIKDRLLLGQEEYFMDGIIDFSIDPIFWSKLFKYLVIPGKTAK